MKLYNAINLGKTIERYNKYFKEEQHLDFHEVVNLMYDQNDNKEALKIIKEINKRIHIKFRAMDLYINGILTECEYAEIIKSL